MPERVRIHAHTIDFKTKNIPNAKEGLFVFFLMWTIFKSLLGFLRCCLFHVLVFGHEVPRPEIEPVPSQPENHLGSRKERHFFF